MHSLQNMINITDFIRKDKYQAEIYSLLFITIFDLEPYTWIKEVIKYHEILISFVKSFIAFSCSFVRQTGNCLAHELARLDLGSSSYLEGDVLPAALANIFIENLKQTLK